MKLISDMKKPRVVAFLLGFVSIISQIILLRELISVFYGNELIYAIFLSAWLFWIAIGSFVASRVEREFKNIFSVLYYLFYATCILSPSSLLFVRLFRSVAGVSVGEVIGIIPIMQVVFLIVAPLAIVFGIMYSFACRFAGQFCVGDDEFSEIKSVYYWEAIGSALGGILFTFVLVHFFSALKIAFLASLISVFIVLLLDSRKTKHFRAKMFIRIVIVLILVFSGLISKLDYLTREIQWKGFKLVEVVDSIYGNITITESQGKKSLFENGLHVFTSEDVLSSEEAIHYPMLAHHNPKKVLLIGSGLGGGLKEALKYDGVFIDYVEMDPMVVKVARRNLSEEDRLAMNSENVRIIKSDGRAYVKRLNSQYDVVIVGLGDPLTAAINRYYTVEFFKEIKGVLRAGGLLSLNVSSSENYLNDETIDYLRSINSTLKEVFLEIKSIPGDNNIFLAGIELDSISIEPKVLSQRLEKRGIDTTYVRDYYMGSRLSPYRIANINDVLRAKGEINSDMRSITYLNSIVQYSTHFNYAFRSIFYFLKKIKFYYLMVLPLSLFFIGLFLMQKVSNSSISLSIMTTGFSEILFQIIVILAFQSLYGYAYYKIGLIIASFMVGLVFGVGFSKVFDHLEYNALKRVYRCTQLSICVYPVLLPVIFYAFSNMTMDQKNMGIFSTVFALLPIIAGFIGGLQYLLATRIIAFSGKKGIGKIGASAGFLYAIDVFGASVGAFLAATFLIPIYGIVKVSILCFSINAAVWLLLRFENNKIDD